LNHSLCMSADGGTVWAFGDGDYGKLGLGNTTRQLAPARVEALHGVLVKKLAAGAQFSVALSRDGTLYTWGHGMVVFLVASFCVLINIPVRNDYPRSHNFTLKL